MNQEDGPAGRPHDPESHGLHEARCRVVKGPRRHPVSGYREQQNDADGDENRVPQPGARPQRLKNQAGQDAVSVKHDVQEGFGPGGAHKPQQKRPPRTLFGHALLAQRLTEWRPSPGTPSLTRLTSKGSTTVA